MCAALDVPLSQVLATLSQRVAVVESLTAPVALPVSTMAQVSASAA